MSTAQQYPGRPSGGIDRLLQRVVGIEQRVRDMRSNLLKNAGIHVVPGGLSIEGNLAVPNGSISNDALENPLTTGNGWDDSDGFSIGATQSNVCTFDLIVPAGYSRALVTALGVAFCYNDTATFTYMRARVYIDSPSESTWGRQLYGPVGASGGSNNLSVNKQSYLDGLSGGDHITCRLAMSSDFVTMASASNGASINAVALFLR